ncbi:PorP/SprF family type IX secretion system membrane protein [Bacteroidota bacterium]|nr:PorP/SprF family type IX secretion system membrane protein [Bacteroidota bacterium]
MMKRIIYILSLVFLALSVDAQQFPLQSQYHLNYSTINPAAVGESQNYIVKASLRQQWVGFSDNSIGTNILTLNKGFGNNGLGLNIFDDQTGGAFSKTGASLSFSHRVPFEGSELFLGISGGLAKVNFEMDQFDPAILSNDDIVPEATFGAIYKYQDYTIGVSVPGLLNANMEITESNSNVIYSHFYTMVSYKKQLNENWSVYPSILLKTARDYTQYDLNLNFKVKDKIWLGASYRQDFGPSLYVGLDLGKLISVYSYDVSTNEVSSYSNGSHEMTFIYEFVPGEKIDEIIEENKEDVEILDRDMDGVVDSIDICPDTYGNALANGCPDTDKDGIPDKFDVCPNLFGEKEAQGCPVLSTREREILENALVDLQFGFDKDEIEYSSYNTLTDLSILMLKNPNMNLIIEGHASEEGSEKYNLSLSARRAKSVQSFFIKRGIEKNRLTIDFYGEKSPINSNNTEEERALNRRVEFDIIFHDVDQKTVSSMIAEYDSLLTTVGTNLVQREADMYIQESKKQMTQTVNKEEIQEKIIENDIIEEEKVEPVIEKIENTESNNDDYQKIDDFDINSTYYILVTEVFSSERNAKKVVKKSNESLDYVFNNNKYYIFASRSNDRKDVELFRSTFEGKSWIKTIK